MKAWNREEIPALLREHGINPTRQRVEIGHALFSRGEHLSADQVLSLVNAESPETSRATVYNTLNLFVEHKLVRRVIVDPTRIFYDPNTGDHHHFYDVVNGRLTDIDAASVKVAGLPKLPKGAVAEGVDVIIRIRPKVL
ncbi:MAG: Fur family transcriptional regulator [Burkholderiales bacterium]